MNSFMLHNSVGNCAGKQSWGNHWGYLADQSKYSYCICCGDKYDPEASLGCPDSPWANKGNLGILLF